MTFAHIHLHTEYSALDGYGTAEQYISRAKEKGETNDMIKILVNADTDLFLGVGDDEIINMLSPLMSAGISTKPHHCDTVNALDTGRPKKLYPVLVNCNTDNRGTRCNYRS